MIARTIRKTSLLNWRLRLQTSGIYRVSAIPGSCNTGAGRASPGPGLVWPRKSALGCILQSLTLCSGQHQSSRASGIRKACSCRRSGRIVVVDRKKVVDAGQNAFCKTSREHTSTLKSGITSMQF